MPDHVSVLWQEYAAARPDSWSRHEGACPCTACRNFALGYPRWLAQKCHDLQSRCRELETELSVARMMNETKEGEHA